MRRLAIAATLLVCLVAAPETAAAKAPRSFYGVIAASDPTPAAIDRMGQGQVGTLRIIMSWGMVQSGPAASLDWSHYDAIIGRAAQDGIRVLPTIYGSPTWVSPHPNAPPDSTHIGQFQAFVRAAAERYGNNGTYWAQNPGIPKMAITDWQIWNEVNSPSFWFPVPNAKDYVSLLQAAHDGIKSGDPSARIVLSGLFLTPRIAHGIFVTKFLPQIYKAGGKNLFDSVAIHPYATTPHNAVVDLREVRRIMARFGDKRKPLWVTEVGWGTGGSPNTALTVSAAKQAKYVSQTFNQMAANRGRLRIQGVVWYSFQDLPGSIWFNHTGLFTTDFAPKPSWRAFTRVTGGTP
jgi:polysaccharide biosynthesis protein PslG